LGLRIRVQTYGHTCEGRIRGLRMKHEAIGALLVLTGLMNPLIAMPQERAAQSSVARFADFGELRIESIEPVNSQPKLVISDASSGKLIFSASLGEKAFPEERSKPTLRFTVIDRPNSQSPLILGIAASAGADGCRYEGVVVGESGNRLTTLTPNAIKTSVFEEGMYLGDLGNSRGFGLAVWNPIVGPEESIVDTHRYAVSLYRYAPARLQFRLVSALTSRQKYGDSADALVELGLRYKNLAPRC
jgi:hypothetical protein